MTKKAKNCKKWQKVTKKCKKSACENTEIRKNVKECPKKRQNAWKKLQNARKCEKKVRKCRKNTWKCEKKVRKSPFRGLKRCCRNLGIDVFIAFSSRTAIMAFCNFFRFFSFFTFFGHNSVKKSSGIITVGQRDSDTP